ncbi:MAG: hypothetical protein RR932_12185 [Acinetobacter sp.]
MSSNAIIIGEDEQHPLIEISVPFSKQEKEYKKIPFLDAFSNIASVAAQAAPALMTAAEVANKHIMEVVIHGNLAKAADGNGLRAFSRATNGQFTEHARLYHADSLSNLVNAAAVWQIASVVVAQKHLADINKKLDNIQDGIDQINNFLQVERKTKIQAIAESLKEKAELLSKKPEQRKHIIDASILSKYDDDLKQIYLHLKSDIESYGLKKVEHKEMFGTAELKAAIEQKINKMEELIDLAFLCLNMRLIGCHLIDYLADVGFIKEARQQHILGEVKNIKLLIQEVKENITDEIESMYSFVNVTQDAVKNNKEKILIGTGLVMPALGLIGAAVSLLDKNSNQKSDILAERKKELSQKLSKFSINCTQKHSFTKRISNQGIDTFIEKEPPITLAFQKLDDQHVLCLNTGEKIAV